jgi:hypothetical protein
MLTAVLLVLAQPGDVVQSHDLGTMTWQRAKGLDGQRVRVRFTVDRVAVEREPDTGEVVLAVVRRPPGEWRYITLPERDLAKVAQGARLEAEGVLRANWDALPDERRMLWGVFLTVRLDDARLVK